jgi:tetratricopeptide (TPR) repeat protein
MFSSSHYSNTSTFRAIPISLLAFALLVPKTLIREDFVLQAPTGRAGFSRVLDLLYRQKYNEAIIEIERVLEREPANGEALTYLATAHLYQDLAYTKALNEFDTAFHAGGGATFFVTHSHESFSTGYVVDYCKGWLHLRAGGIEFVPTDGSHTFKSKYDEVKEFKINRLSKKVFHIKVGENNRNFRGRTNSEAEPLLIIALYKNFARN